MRGVPAPRRWDRARASWRGQATDADHVVLAELGYLGEADHLTCSIKKPAKPRPVRFQNSVPADLSF
jgi:hypothetical protein